MSNFATSKMILLKSERLVSIEKMGDRGYIYDITWLRINVKTRIRGYTFVIKLL